MIQISDESWARFQEAIQKVNVTEDAFGRALAEFHEVVAGLRDASDANNEADTPATKAESTAFPGSTEDLLPIEWRCPSVSGRSFRAWLQARQDEAKVNVLNELIRRGKSRGFPNWIDDWSEAQCRQSHPGVVALFRRAGVVIPRALEEGPSRAPAGRTVKPETDQVIRDLHYRIRTLIRLAWEHTQPKGLSIIDAKPDPIEVKLRAYCAEQATSKEQFLEILAGRYSGQNILWSLYGSAEMDYKIAVGSDPPPFVDTASSEGP